MTNLRRPVEVRPVTAEPAPNGQPAAAIAPPRFDVLEAIRSGTTVPAAIHDALANLDLAIDVRDFNLWYGQRQAIHSITMPIPRGKVTAMIGPSGCGKSTLLRSMNRMNDLIDGVRVSGLINLSLDRRFAGSAGEGGGPGAALGVVPPAGGQSIFDKGVDVIALRRRVGMVFQKPNPFPMSIFENVVYPLRIVGERRKAVLTETAERALQSAAIWDEVKDRLKQSALGLSGGQQQRLCIARAIAAEPDVMLMDEPCSALDPIATMRIEELIRELAARITIVIVTHNMQQAARVSDFTAFMYLGRLVEYGRTVDIFQNPHLAETEQYVTGRFG